ncbi:MAG: hypothetical protein LRY69_06045 [Gammaproteobacteria bacterium]|nr:hypothetical protein [Gammaproteobacteria bacterium]
MGRPIVSETDTLTLDNRLLGLQGPVSVSGSYTSNYGYELQAQLSEMVSLNDAIGVLGAYASEENRIDITWAHSWTEKQRTKLSVERLEEKMDFDYDSGATSVWVPQYAYGAAYQYLFNDGWLKNVELSTYYANAKSQNLDTIRFETDGEFYDNYRHVAGAISQGSAATLNILPWSTGLVGLGLNYDRVNYDTKYDDTEADDSEGFGFTLSLEQLLSKHLKMTIEGSQREVYDRYVAGISLLTPSNLEIGVSGERILGENGSASDTRFNLNLAYFLDDRSRYTSGYALKNLGESDLASWAAKSVAFMDQVLAAADQKTVLAKTTNDMSDNEAIDTDTSDVPVITLKSGEINRINIADHIATLNLSEAQKQASPVILGGPQSIVFTYDNVAQSLVTESEVPEPASVISNKPLILIFPEDKLDRGIETSASHKLIFKVLVGTSSATSPSLNPVFIGTEAPVLGQAQTWVFNYENIEQPMGPADSETMFLNPNPSYANLKIKSITANIKIGTHNCYTATLNDDPAVQTLTVKSVGSSVCPDAGVISVVATNGFESSPTQTITFTQQPSNSPFVGSGPITSPAMLGGDIYSPGHTFTSSEVSAGTGQAFKTSLDDSYVKVFDTGSSGSSCTEVTSAAGFNLAYSNNDTVAILQSTQNLPTNLVGHLLKIYLHVTNTVDLSADNGTTSSCAGQPFTAVVYGSPVIPENLNMGLATVDQTYTYNFMTQGGGDNRLFSSQFSVSLK